MAAPTSFYVFEGENAVVIGKWKVKVGSQLLPRTVIFTYHSHSDQENEKSDDKTVMKLESSIGGTVLELLVKEGEIIKPGTQLMKIRACSHEVIMKDLCAICGADLRQKCIVNDTVFIFKSMADKGAFTTLSFKTNTGQISFISKQKCLSTQNLQEVFASRSFSMVHVVPELRCSLEQAEQLDRADEVRLLKSRKLVLLVDLDQTLIHTTNDDVPVDLKNVHHFQLYGPRSTWYHTRLRPHTEDFLKKISKYYELHIFTFGARLYAHKIASILDPNRALFSHRILSRDECFDATSKTGNLKVLFPRGDAMVGIIDDREDVWNFAPNVIHVKPYIFFNNTGDINNPNLMRGPIYPPKRNIGNNLQDSACDVPEPIVVDENSMKECEKDESTNHRTPNSVSEATEDSPPEKCSLIDCDVVGPLDDCIEEVCEVNGKKDMFDDDDDYLLYLEEILIRIHGAYFDLYDEMCSQDNATKSKVPDLKNVIPYVRRKVLRGVNLVFSGVIPTNVAPEKNSLWSLAKSLGAEVFHDLITHDRRLKTTHVVASKAGTAKISRAKKSGSIHIVTPSWLICCATRWERVDERLFPLRKGDGASSIPPPILQNNAARDKLKACGSKKGKARLKRTEAPKQGNDGKEDLKGLKPVLDISLEELDNMDREVDEACTSSEDEFNEYASEKNLRGLKRKRSTNFVQATYLEDNVGDDEKSLRFRDEGEDSENSSFAQNVSATNGESSDTENSVTVMSSGEEELVAEMERELFGT